MESSEDDAGAATNASRAVSAREKDIGASEDGGTSSGTTQETSETGMASETASIPEEVFGPDSVPSPSTHDVNTSTEALLDMIDEIVEGPGAPKRLSLSSDHNDTNDGIANTSECSHSDYGHSSSEVSTEPAQILSSEPTVSLDNESKESISDPISQNDIVSSDVKNPCSETVDNVALEPISNAESVKESNSVLPTNNQSVTECRTAAVVSPELQQNSASTLSSVISESITPTVNITEDSKLEETNNIPLLDIPTSSVETVKNVSDVSESQVCERTIKCVSSSDSRENVTVESAESTSSDNSIISEGRSVVPESVTRSPLKRRLVRPVPVSVLSDRRPDSTVSSTADSQSADVHTTEETSSEIIVKDVSSSSDAVSSASGSVKPEEIRNLSEISVCKAETSTSPTKKIKLVRQKVSSVPVHQDNTETIPERELCQSTSCETVPSASVPELNNPKSNFVNNPENIASSEAKNQELETVPHPTQQPCASTEDTPINDQSNPQSQGAVLSLDIEPEIDHSNEKPPLESNLSPENISARQTCDKPNVLSESSDSPDAKESPESTKQVPKLTIKLSGKQAEEIKSPIPKLTIKPVKPPPPSENVEANSSENIPSVTKLNIKPITKPIKINDIHRKSSSSEISESESSENDESNSTSDQASTSDQCSMDVVPKVTIKLGKPGTESEGKFYTEQNVPKLTIKGIHHNENDEQELTSKLKLVISQTDDQPEKVPKLTIKTVGKSDQPLSPKLIIKPLKLPDNESKDSSSELFINTDSTHIPKITIKPVLKSDSDIGKTNKKSNIVCDSPEHIPVVTKLNIKPIVKPAEVVKSDNLEEKVPVVSKLNIKPIVKPIESSDSECTEDIPVVSKLNIKPVVKPIDTGEAPHISDEKVPVVSKLNIKPVLKPKDNDVDSSVEEVPKVTKLNIKPLKNPEEIQETKDCDVNAGIEKNSLPVVTKLNIKPIIKPTDEETSKDSENQSSETGNSSDDNGDHIPVVTKLNIKPIVKPNDSSEISKSNECNEESIPVVTKLHIKPLVKPEEVKSPISPRRESLRSSDSKNITVPNVTKLNIKPIVKPDEIDQHKLPETDDMLKHPPLVMKINMKTMAEIPTENKKDYIEPNFNTFSENIPTVTKLNIKPVVKPTEMNKPQISASTTEKVAMNCLAGCSSSAVPEHPVQNCVPETEKHVSTVQKSQNEKSNTLKTTSSEVNESIINKTPAPTKQQSSLQNCSLLKKLLEPKKDGLDNRLEEVIVNHSNTAAIGNTELENINSESDYKSKNVNEVNNIGSPERIFCQEDLSNKNLTKPLEINVSEKVSTQNSGQDSPRIILKINKTDHGPSAKIITEESQRPASAMLYDTCDNTHENDVQKKNAVNSRKKITAESPSVPMGKRLRSSRIVEEKTPVGKRNAEKRVSSTETPLQSKDSELSVLETKRLKLGQLLSNKSLSITPVTSSASEVFQTKVNKEVKQAEKTVNHSILNNANCSKNGNSKLHNILSNLQAKQAQALSFNDVNRSDKSLTSADFEMNASTGSSDVVEIVPINSHTEVQEMIINENSESHEFNVGSDDLSQDPLDTSSSSKPNIEVTLESPTISHPEITPQPKKRGRPRKIPLSEGAKPVALPVPALEERPQRSLRLSRDRPAILTKPRGRGRGRGAKRAEVSPREDNVDSPAKLFEDEDRHAEDIDPMSSRIKLPRMTEALDKMPSVCSTPLSSRRRSSEMDLKVVLDSIPVEEYKSPETPSRGPGSRGGRGARGRGRTPGRSPRGGPRRGRGGGRGAVYMKETMGIYGRVCGPATTTVQLFEEETCMMDDNATPDKPSSHLLDEDSQSSVKSSTNESSKMKKSKFADLFDSNKIWTAADVKEYTWPPPDTPNVEHQIMMIQEQVAMFLGVKSFKRRYPELKRRTIGGDERDYVLQKGLVSEALCDLGITAVDASEVLDIMLSDYPHKYEEYRSHQRTRQLTEAAEDDSKTDVKVEKIDVKIESKPAETKPEPSKIDLEKSRQDMAAAAIASASEFNSRINALRRPACVDLQTLTVHRPRGARAPLGPPGPPVPPGVGAPAPVPEHVQPPGGFYPHALLPGQYQHWYRVYTPEQLRYFPLNTVMAAPPAPASPVPSSSDSEQDWNSSSSSDESTSDRMPKRKKLMKTKRSSQAEPSSSSAPVKEETDEELCRACGLRIEANRKYTHERFLVCAKCNAKLHPSCVELSADTIRKCREYEWQCAECKTCCACARPQDDDKMLFCDLCDRGFHIYCVGLDKVPTGRWHCAECAICKSCGARDPNGPPAAGGPAEAAPGGPLGSVSVAGGGQWHHHTRRGPGGHKVYSHSLCTPCARAYRIGRYCPLCDRSFIGPKGTMQLVICKLCDRQHHQECVRQTVSALKVLDYTCGECRRGGITSRAAAARLAPRTIATLFMAKRRFNKYAHRQYLQSRQGAKGPQPEDTSNDVPEDIADAADPAESCEPIEQVDDASEASDAAVDDTDPLEGVGDAQVDPPHDETAAAVEALRMDFGD